MSTTIKTDIAIISRDNTNFRVAMTAGALKLKAAALEKSALIGAVTDAKSNETAVEAQTQLKDVLTLFEKSRKAAKQPVLEFCATIDETVKTASKEVVEELTRLAEEIGSYLQLEQAKANAARQTQAEEASRLEKEKAAALAQATTHEQADAIQQHFNEQARVLDQAVVEAPRAKGQVARSDWDITITDIHLLYRTYPNCVELKPRLSEIKNVLKQGITPKGVIAKPIVIATVRAAAVQPAIEA